ncbi:MAG: LytR C-terminal domain-containing protein [Nitrospirae bacterium]|nr:LytR C-terminal domain-containing protein [Nitrospirota bacterium]
MVLGVRAAEASAQSSTPTPVFVVDGSNKLVSMDRVRAAVESAGFSLNGIRPAKKKTDKTYVLCEESAKSEAVRLVDQLGLSAEILTRGKIKQAPIMLVLGADWADPPGPKKTVRNTKRRRSRSLPWMVGLAAGFIPVGSLTQDELGEQSSYSQSMDVGPELTIERVWARWISTGLALSSLVTFHAETENLNEPEASSNLGQQIMLAPYLRVSLPVADEYTAFARGGIGPAYFRPNGDEETQAAGYSGSAGVGAMWSAKKKKSLRRWSVLGEASAHFTQFYPYIINSWTLYYARLGLGVGYRF